MTYQILPNLYLSGILSASCNVCLQNAKITNILTLDAKPLDNSHYPCADHMSCNADHESRDRNYQRPISYFVEILDCFDSNILEKFEECFEIISKWMLDEENKILVHCVAGISRSATVVVGYTMQMLDLTLNEALQQAQEKKPAVRPNPSFMYQLQLFEKMDKKVDRESPYYKALLVKLKQATEGYHYQEDFWGLKNLSENDVKVTKELTYKCRVCRRILFTSEDLNISHETETKDCTSLYLNEPLEWMQSEMKSDVQGKILCHKCKAKLGSFNWSGRTCSCGSWVTPSFQVQKARVDFYCL